MTPRKMTLPRRLLMPALFSATAAAALALLPAVSGAQSQPAPPAPAPESPAQVVPVQQNQQVTYLGVGTGQLDSQVRQNIGLPEGFGLQVSQVTDDSPAAQAGLQVGDILVEIDGQKLTSYAHLATLVRSYADGDEATVGYYRDGQFEEAQATFAQQEGPPLQALLDQAQPRVQRFQMNQPGTYFFQPQGFGGMQGRFGQPNIQGRAFMLTPQGMQEIPMGNGMFHGQFPGQPMQMRRMFWNQNEGRPMRLQLRLNGDGEGNEANPFGGDMEQEMRLELEELRDMMDGAQNPEVRRALEEARRALEEMNQQLDQQPRPVQGRAERRPDPRPDAQQDQRNVQVNISNDAGTINYTASNGEETVIVKDPGGTVTYEGAVPTTDEQWEQIPEPMRETLRRTLRQIERQITPAAPARPARQARPARPAATQQSGDEEGTVRV